MLRGQVRVNPGRMFGGEEGRTTSKRISVSVVGGDGRKISSLGRRRDSKLLLRREKSGTSDRESEARRTRETDQDDG